MICFDELKAFPMQKKMAAMNPIATDMIFNVCCWSIIFFWSLTLRSAVRRFWRIRCSGWLYVFYGANYG